MQRRTTAAVALIAGASLAVGPILGASAATGNTPIINGDFEADPAGSSIITGWTAMNQLIDLGVTSIAGCVTVDTSDYTQLRDYYDEAEVDWERFGDPVPDQSDVYYVESRSGDPISVLGYRLVFDDWEWAYGLEVPVIEPLSAAEDEVEILLPGEPTEQDPASPTEESSSEDTPVASEEGESASDSAAEETPAEETPAEETPAPAQSPATFAPVDVLPTFDYIYEWDWTIEQEDAFDAVAAQYVPDPSVRQDNVSTPNFFESEEFEFATTIVDLSQVSRYDEELDDDVPLGTGLAVELYSDMYNDEGYDGYVAHGPAIYSNTFSVNGAREISFDWTAVDESDDFKVFGYLLNVDTCQQTEVVDATGLSQDWTTTTLTIPTAGTYRFVFVSGTFDQSFGGAAGAYMYIDNIVQKPAFSSPGVSIELAAKVGDYLPGSDVEIAGGGLLANSDYDLVLRSTPVLVAEGVADDLGEFLEIVTLPESVTPGAHTITLTGIAPNGEELTAVVYITVGTDGTLLYVSDEGPEPVAEPEPELAMTGAETNGIAALAGLLLLAGAAAMLTARRRVVAD